MTNTPDSNRLDRIEASLEQLTNTVSSIVQIVEIHQANHEASQRNFDTVVNRLETIETEIKGLRTESLRILEHIFGEQSEQ